MLALLRRRKTSLFRKIFTISILCLLVPMLVSLFYSSNLIKNSLEDEVSASLLSIVFEKQNQIELALDNVFEQAIAISTQPYILETFQEAANNNDQLDPDRLHKISAHLKGIFDRGNGLFENIFLIYRDTTVADGIGGNSLGWKPDEQTLSQLGARKDPLLRPPRLSPTTGNPVITIMAPIRGERGEFQGIIGLAIELAVLSEKIVERGKVSNINTLILDSAGLILSSADPAHVMQISFQEEDDALKDFYKIMLTKGAGTGFLSFEGAENIAAFTISEYYNLLSYMPVSEYMGTISNLRSGLFLVILSSVLLAALVVFIFSRRITRPILSISEYANSLAEGDLSQAINERYLKRRDELGRLAQAFNKMNTNLKKMIGDIILTSEQVAAASEELLASGEQVGETAEQVGTTIESVAAGAEEQSAQVDGTIKNLNNLIQQIEEVESGTDNVKMSADNLNTSVHKGSESVNDSITKIIKLKNDTEEVSRVVSNLGEVSEKIGEIVGLINNIAGQTNMLALNAAIEAARAGEAGRGFSVVADEIRTLAEESEKATAKITELIKAIRTGVGTAISKMSDSIQSVNLSVEAIKSNGEIFEEINDEARKLEEIVANVSENVQTMIKSSQNFVMVMQEIARVSDEFASSSEEVAASSEEQVASTEEIVALSKKLAEFATELTITVNEFKL